MLACVYGWWIFHSDRLVRLSGTLESLGGNPQPQNTQQWRVELTGSTQEIARIRAAQQSRQSGEFDVDFILTNEPSKRFRGKLVPLDAEPEDANSDRLVVRVHPINDDIPESMRIPEEVCVQGVEVRARIRVPLISR